MKVRYPVILDSGAFSAWTKGEEIDLEEYTQYALDNAPYVDRVINLDVIPGRPNVKPTFEQVEASAIQSFKNFLYMRDRGVDVIPVYHQGERIQWLHRMLDEGCDYVGISPANDKTPAQRRQWLDYVFGFLVDRKGDPVIKTHAFGVTSLMLLKRYPWYSADSATWALAGAYGGVYVPKMGPDGYDFLEGTSLVVFSGKSLKNGSVRHFDLLPEAIRNRITQYMLEYGIRPQVLRVSYKARDEMNSWFFVNVEEQLMKHHPEFVDKIKKVNDQCII